MPQIHIQGDKEVIRGLQAVINKISDWKPELETIGDYLVKRYGNEVFETEGGFLGKRWAKLRPSYDFFKRKNFSGRGTLQRTGAMRKSFESSAGKTEVVVSNKTPYAVFHQFGNKRMPQRVMMDVNDRMADDLGGILTKSIIERYESS